MLMAALPLAACEKDDAGGENGDSIFDSEEYCVPTEDALRVVSDLLPQGSFRPHRPLAGFSRTDPRAEAHPGGLH